MFRRRRVFSFAKDIFAVLVLFPAKTTSAGEPFAALVPFRSPKLDQTKENLRLIFRHIFSVLALDDHVATRRDDKNRRDGVIVVVCVDALVFQERGRGRHRHRALRIFTKSSLLLPIFQTNFSLSFTQESPKTNKTKKEKRKTQTTVEKRESLVPPHRRLLFLLFVSLIPSSPKSGPFFACVSIKISSLFCVFFLLKP